MPIRRPVAKLKEVAEKKKEPVRPMVTQVVEVLEIIEEKEVTAQPDPVERKDEKTKDEIPQPPSEEKPSENEEVAPPDEMKDEPSVTREEEEEEEKEKKAEEKVVISDLFQKKDTIGIPEISMHKSSSSRTMIVWSSAVITVAVLLGGALFVSTKGGKISDLSLGLAKPTLTPTAAPSPTPKPAQRGDISVQVLNGGGVSGAATKMKTFLEDKGYTVGDTGNTDEYTYDKTVVLVKAGNEVYAELLKTDLADEYTLEASASDTLASDSTYDAQVIVGKK